MLGVCVRSPSVWAVVVKLINYLVYLNYTHLVHLYGKKIYPMYNISMLPLLAYLYFKQSPLSYYLSDAADLLFAWYFLTKGDLPRDQLYFGVLMLIYDNSYFMSFVQSQRPIK